MTTKTHVYLIIKLLIFISATSLVLSSCDIIDTITDAFQGNEDELDALQMEINDVIDIQENVGSIIDDLFSTGMETIAVKDSLASYFKQEDSVERVWINRQGVAVEYKSGIRGGVFFSPFTDLNAGKVVAKTQSKREYKETFDKEIVSLIGPKKAILLSSADSEFQEKFTIEGDSKNAFTRIGISNFEVKKNNGAELKYYKNLSEYGVVHFSGHGWPWPDFEGDSRGDFKDVYLLTGEKVDKITAKDEEGYIKEDSKDQLLIGQYCFKQKDGTWYTQNRVWVSPQYIIDNNTFNADSVVVYGSFCYSFIGGWPLLVNDANAEVYVGYSNSVFPNKDADWAKRYYYDLTATHNDEPMSVDFWYKGIEHENKHYYIDGNDRVEVEYQGNKDFEFWKEDEPETLEFTKVCMSYAMETDWSNSDWYGWQDWGVCVGPISLTLTKSGNTYSGSYQGHSSWNPGSAYSGSITYTLRDDENTVNANGQTNWADVVNFTFKTTRDETLMWNDLTISMTDVKYTVNNNGDIGFQIDGQVTCSHVHIQSNSVDTNGTHSYIRDYRCTDDSKVAIGFSND